MGIVALASAINAFVYLGETVIMVQRPQLNLLHSLITCAVAFAGFRFLWLIPRFGAFGAAVGILPPYRRSRKEPCVTPTLRWYSIGKIPGAIFARL